jgi:hypothetical protein
MDEAVKTHFRANAHPPAPAVIPLSFYARFRFFTGCAPLRKDKDYAANRFAIR